VTTAAGSAASTHGAAQAALGTALATQVGKVWPLLDPTRLDQSIRLVSGALVPVVQQHAMASRALANEHYQSVRMHAGIVEPFLTQGTALPTPEKVYDYVAWATKPARDLAPDKSDQIPQLLIPAQQTAAGALGKLVADTGRQQIVDNVMADRHAKAWAREAPPDACWFCAMLATRGAVYRSAWAAGRRTFEGVEYNTFHTHCHCQVVPVFSAYEAPLHVRQWQQLYKDSTKGASGADKAWAFQEAYEGRTIQRRTKKWSGYGKPNRGGGGKKPKSRDEQLQIAAGMSNGTAQKALNRARELYVQEGDPVGDRASWISVLEDKLGQGHQELPAMRNLFDSWDDAKLQSAIATARRLLGQKGDPKGDRAAWIAKLMQEQARRAGNV
jgi:hypothetical protein